MLNNASCIIRVDRRVKKIQTLKNSKVKFFYKFRISETNELPRRKIAEVILLNSVD